MKGPRRREALVFAAVGLDWDRGSIYSDAVFVVKG